jgi:hypothetical protein
MTSKRTVIAIVAAVAAFGAVSASAASLGGLGTKSLGADTSVVASCDTNGVDVVYNTAYNATAKEYVVNSVALSNINASCNNQTATVTLATATAPLATASLTLTAATSATFTFSAPVSAESVEQVAVLIAD